MVYLYFLTLPWALAEEGLCSLVACGCTDGFIRVYDYARNFDTHALRGHGGPFTALLFHTFALPIHGSTIPPHRSLGSGGVHAVAMKFAKKTIASLHKKSA